MLVVLVAVFGATTLGGTGDGGVSIASSAPVPAPAAQLSSEPAMTTTTTTPAPAVATSTTTPARPTSSVATTTSMPAPPPPPTTASTVAPAPTTLPRPTPTTTFSTVACRNSTNPACGPFRFDPQPGPDNPMSVHVLMAPASPVAGQEVVFTIELHDPDGVSLNGATYNYGDGGLAGSSVDPCTKFGPWDPPPRDPAHANQVVTLRHTYAAARTYTATFYFTGFPFGCEDAVTGRGDRPYASSASGTVTFDVR